MNILGLDPGPETSGVVTYNPAVHGIRDPVAVLPNEQVFARIHDLETGDIVACEMIASYGMPVGAETFETCVWIGRFMEYANASGVYFERRTRIQVRMHHCHHPHAGDPNVNQAVADRFGGGKVKGTKKAPGPLYGIKEHAWAALAVALVVGDTR